LGQLSFQQFLLLNQHIKRRPKTNRLLKLCPFESNLGGFDLFRRSVHRHPRDTGLVPRIGSPFRNLAFAIDCGKTGSVGITQSLCNARAGEATCEDGYRQARCHSRIAAAVAIKAGIDGPSLAGLNGDFGPVLSLNYFSTCQRDCFAQTNGRQVRIIRPRQNEGLV
jgi:hypothetical protein